MPAESRLTSDPRPTTPAGHGAISNGDTTGHVLALFA